MLLEPESMLGVIGGSQSLCQELWVEPEPESMLVL